MSLHARHLPGRFAPGAVLLAAALAIALAGPSAASAARGCQSTKASPSSASKRTMVRATVCLLNDKRARRGLPSLRLSGRLSRAARAHSRDMARRNYFSHNSLSGADFIDRIRRSGYLRNARRWTVGENLAWGSGSRATPRAIVRSWMRSHGHRANILDGRFRHIGVGIAYDAPADARGLPAATYTTDFGAKG
jgi:uncharacterized protein YkwD